METLPILCISKRVKTLIAQLNYFCRDTPFLNFARHRRRRRRPAAIFLHLRDAIMFVYFLA